MPAPEAEDFVRRVAESVGSLVARLRVAEREHQIAVRSRRRCFRRAWGDRRA
jgi:hypothetical protein